MHSTTYYHPNSEMTPTSTAAALQKRAFWAGVIYLITFVSVPTLSLYVSAHQPNYITGSGSDSPILIGAILELIVGLSGIATALTLYPVLKLQNHSAALGLVAARILEATMIFAGVACLLTLVTLRQSGHGTEAISVGHALIAMYDKIFLVSQSLMPAVCDLILGLLFYQSRLIPRVLSVVAIIGAFALASADVAVIFGILEQRAPSTASAAIGVAVFEFSLGIWLVIKGFINTDSLNKQVPKST